MIRITYLLQLLCCYLVLTSCYGPNHLPVSRLKILQQFPDIQYVALDANAPEQNIWLLSEVTFDEQSITARFKNAPEGFYDCIDSETFAYAQKANRDFVYFYIHPYYTAEIKDQTVQRIEFTQIKKIIVFEPELIESKEIFCVSFCSGSIVYFLASALGREWY
ncbi:MAG: hypothetical protein J0M29_13985 [Chitinophagales bacterium]|nr:hypothetical protein [Chitinophagales bacterium]